MSKEILGPAAVLVLWSIVVLMWMAARRYGQLSTAPKDKLREMPRVGGRGQDVDRALPGAANWAAHNYLHLMEQPTLFYATVAILALTGQGTGWNVTLAWGYVLLRVAHSIWQITINTVPVRFALFIASTLCLSVMAINAVRATLL